MTAHTPGAGIRLPWRMVRLENGLTLLMHPDSTFPEVGVEVWIRGGSREEAPGQFGTAHLFEHNLPSSGRFLGDDENRARRSRMIRDRGAGVEPDFIRFYETIRPEGLELALGALADRLESDTSRFTAETLRRDQDIVASELRRSMGSDWDSDVLAHLHRGTFGAGHPYGHPIAGIERDVRAATVEGMREWHRRFAGASSAVVLVAGRFDPARAEAMVRRHFGTIAPGLAPPRLAVWVPPARPVREVLEAEVPRGVVYLRWPVPGWGAADADLLALLARVLSDRLRGAAPPLATASAGVELWEAAGAFTVRGEFGDAAEAERAEALLRDQVERLLAEGPEAGEVERAQAQSESGFYRGLQRLAWRGGRTDVLGMGLLFRGDPDAYQAGLARIASASGAEVREAGRRWLGSPGYVLRVLPRPRWAAAGSVDRGATVETPEPAPQVFPAVRETTLPGGLRVLAAERPGLPLLQLTLLVGAGAATDDPAHAGRARVVLEALARTPVSPGGPPLAEALAAHGAELETRLDADFAVVSLSVLSNRAEPALDLLGAALAGELPDPVLVKAREEAARRLDGALADPMRVRERVLACMLAAPRPCEPGALDGLGTRAGLAALSPGMLTEFRRSSWHPGNAVVAVSGDVEAGRLAETLGSAFAGWLRREAPPAVPASAPGSGSVRGGAAAVVDHPGATQAHLLVAHPLPEEAARDPLPAQLVVWALRQRLMENLRTGKGWSYEVYPFGVDAWRGGGVMRFNIPVQTDRLGDAVAEIRAEVRRLREEPVSEEFLASIRGIVESAWLTRALSSPAAMNERLTEIALGRLPADYHAWALRRLAAFTAADLREAARALLDPDELLWVVAGERAAIEAELREAGLRLVEVRSEDIR